MKPLKRITLLGLLLIVLVGCIQTSSEPEIVATRLVEAPRPPDSFDLQAGAATYTQWCVQCHGPEGRGDGETAAAFTCELPNFRERLASIILSDWHDSIQNGKGSAESGCLMPPWNQRLNEKQMWDVAAYVTSLVYDSELAETGQNLLTSNTNNETPFNFENTRWQADTSDAAILAALNGSQFDGYTLENLSDEEKQAILVYIRSLSYDTYPVEVALAQTPAPVTTDEPIDISVTPFPLSTEEPAASTSETFTITGKVVNGTEGGTVPTDLTLLLRVVALNDQGEPSEVHTAETTLGVEGSYSFTDVPRVERALASVEAEYAGIRQFAPQFAPSTVETETFDLEFPIYETTTDAAAVTVTYMEMLIDAVSAEQASLTFHTFELANMGDKVVIGGDDGKTLEFPLPLDVISPQVEALGNYEGRFEIEEASSGFVIYDTAPLFPGQTRIGVSYGKAYDGEMELTSQLPYPIVEVGVYVSKTRGLALESDQLTFVEDLDFNNMTYAGYSLPSGENLPANTPLTFRVSDGPNANREIASTTNQGDSDEEEKSFLQENVSLILGLGILLIIAGGMFMFYDLQKTRLLTEQQGTKTPIRKNDLIAQIAELDAAFEAGEIDESTYQAERETLKSALRRQMK